MPLVTREEKVLFAACLAISVGAYLAAAAFAPQELVWLAGLSAIGVVLLGWSLGQIRSNGVRISEEQFPEVHGLATELALKLGLARLPAIYVIQQGGALNAFATKFVRRDIVVIYSDVLELAYEAGEAELGFVVAHELAHVKRRHPLWSWVLTPALLVPFLGHAYSRACEYTCDRMAAHACPAGAPRGLLVLAAGKRLYRRVDADLFSRQTETETGFWIWLSEALSSHPHLPKRVAALSTAPAMLSCSADGHGILCKAGHRS